EALEAAPDWYGSERLTSIERLLHGLEGRGIVRLGEPEERLFADLPLPGLAADLDEQGYAAAAVELGEGEDAFLSDRQVRILLDRLQDRVRGLRIVPLREPEEAF